MREFTVEKVEQFGSGITLIPAILDQSIEAVQQKVNKTKDTVERIGIDIIDGIYADNLTISVEDLNQIDFGEVSIEVQLMTEYPEELLGACHTAGVIRAYGHVERMGSQDEYMGLCKELGIQPAFGLDLYTPLDAINERYLLELEGILLMSVKAGFSGQAFNPIVLDKIRKLRERGFTGDIQMDGGINPETIFDCVQAGANQFSVTSFVWKHDSVETALTELKHAIFQPN